VHKRRDENEFELKNGYELGSEKDFGFLGVGA
jgi:hypothetical protein